MPENEWLDSLIDKAITDGALDSYTFKSICREVEAESQHHERIKYLTDLRLILDQMPVAGNGRRLIMQLISKMEARRVEDFIKNML